MNNKILLSDPIHIPKVNSNDFERKEIEFSFMRYPRFYFIKGTNELMSYNIEDKTYDYHKFGLPILMLTDATKIETPNKFEFIMALFDAGEYLIFHSICPPQNNMKELKVYQYKRYLKK